MKKVLSYPLTKICAFYVLGIITQYTLNVSFSVYFLSILCFCLLLLLAYFYYANRKIAFEFTTFPIAFILAFLIIELQNPTFRKSHFTHFSTTNSKTNLEMVIIEKFKTTQKYTRYAAHLIRIDNQNTSGKVILNIPKIESSKELVPSTHILAHARLVTKYPNSVPSRFNYSDYLKNKGIYGQVYTDSNYYIGKNQPSLAYYAGCFRNNIINTLESKIPKNDLALIMALLLGQQQDIDAELMNSYQMAGAVHMLSVSGLHIGILLLALQFLLKFISNTPRNKIIKLCILLAFLWGFALLANFSPAVLRSATMYSFLLFAMYLKRGVYIYYSLLTSLFVILIFSPFMLFDVGFQLSYLALFFIAWLQPIFKNGYTPKNKIGVYFFDIITVSLAAQIGTLPLSLYYFHQFPGLFLLTNVVLLPLLSLLLFVGVIVVLMASIGWVLNPIVELLSCLIGIFNAIIQWVSSFEDFIFKNISFNFSLLLICYFVIVCFFVWIENKKIIYFKMFLMSILALQCNSIFEKYSYINRETMQLLHIYKNSVLIHPKQTTLRVYSSYKIPHTNAEKIINTYAVEHGIKAIKYLSLQNYYYHKNAKVTIITNNNAYLKNTNADVLILINSPKINLEYVLEELKPKVVVADGSNFFEYKKRWKESCNNAKIPFHDTSEKGFYTIR